MENPCRILEVCLKNIGIFCSLESLKAQGITDEYMRGCDNTIKQLMDGQMNQVMRQQLFKEFRRFVEIEKVMMDAIGEELKLCGLNVAEEISYFESLGISMGMFVKIPRPNTFDARFTQNGAICWIRSQIRKNDETKKAANAKNQELVEVVENLNEALKAMKIQIDDLSEMKIEFDGFKREMEKEKNGNPPTSPFVFEFGKENFAT